MEDRLKEDLAWVRKGADDALGVSEARYRRLVEASTRSDLRRCIPPNTAGATSLELPNCRPYRRNVGTPSGQLPHDNPLS